MYAQIVVVGRGIATAVAGAEAVGRGVDTAGSAVVAVGIGV